ncbi:MAG: hypothetical protein ACIAQF_09205 [Phycisphaerales bacterium JB065]
MSEPQVRSFKDAEGREMVVRVNVFTLEKVKEPEDLNFDLLSIAEEEPLRRLCTDYGLLVGILWIVCARSIEKHGEDRGEAITPEEFAESFSGDVLANALDALVQAITDFFPNARQRKNVREIWEKCRRAEDKVQEILGERIGQEMSDEKVDEMARKAVDEALPPSPGSKSDTSQRSSA